MHYANKMLVFCLKRSHMKDFVLEALSASMLVWGMHTSQTVSSSVYIMDTALQWGKTSG